MGEAAGRRGRYTVRMRMLSINGSPRRLGNTAYLLGALEAPLAGGTGDVERIFVHDAGIGPCDDCRACKSGELRCPKADGMAAVYESLERADLLLLGSPIYWSGLTGPMKNLVDRLRPYYKSQRLSGKRLVVVTVGASAGEESDLVDTMYRRVSGALGMAFAGHVVREGFDLGDVERRGFRLGPEEVEGL